MTVSSIKYRMADNNIDWGTLLSGAGAAKALDILYNMWKERKRKKVQATETINNTVKIYTALSAINTGQCLRRCVLKAHNGGHKLDVRTHKYVTMLYEDFYPPFESDIDKVHNWRMDEAYIKMLADVTINKKTTLITKDLPPCSLKDLYDTKKVTFSELYYIGEDGSSLFFMSFSTDQTITGWNPITRTEIKVCVDRITKLLNF